MALQRPNDPRGVPEHIPDEHADEYRALKHDDRLALTPQALARWTGGLTVDDYTLTQVVSLECKRNQNLRTLRAGAELTDMEYRLLRYLQRHDGQVCTYVQICHHLWGSAQQPITAATLRKDYGLASSMVGQIHVLVSFIRRKLEVDPIRPQHLATVRGVGYVWYAAPPSLDDGVNYDKRATDYRAIRQQIMAELGLIEGEFVATRPLDSDGAEIETRYLLGPEYDEIVRSKKPRGRLRAPSERGDELDAGPADE